MYAFRGAHEVVVAVLDFCGYDGGDEDFAEILEAEGWGGVGEECMCGVEGPGGCIKAWWCLGVGWRVVATDEDDFATDGAEVGDG